MADQPLRKTYCVGCHNQNLNTAGIALDALDLNNVASSTPTWERVLHKTRRGEMPPPGLPRPDAGSAAQFAASVEKALDSAAAAHANPGSPAVHRLNRAEYGNAIRDLLALD